MSASSHSAVGRIQAQLLESASERNGAGADRADDRLSRCWAVLAGALIGVIVALAIGRNDRRLRARDEIANSIGIPVLASVPVAHPSAAAGWTKLFEELQARPPCTPGSCVQPCSSWGWPDPASAAPRTTATAVPRTTTASHVRRWRPLLAHGAVPLLRSRRSRPGAATGRLRRLAGNSDVACHRPAAGRSRHGHASHRVRCAAVRGIDAPRHAASHRLRRGWRRHAAGHRLGHRGRGRGQPSAEDARHRCGPTPR